jgi:hypothetical protein
MQRHAQPLVDTADDIVRRALDALEGKSPEASKTARKSRRRSNGRAPDQLPQREFREPLLVTLRGLGGAGSLDEVRKAIYPRIKAKLRSGDHRTVATGEPRWWNAICWERNELVKEGYLRSDSARGRWELSAEGYRNIEEPQSSS